MYPLLCSPWILETAKAAQGSVDLTYMESAVATDDTHLTITLSQPTSIFLNTLASVGIVPEHAYSEDYGQVRYIMEYNAGSRVGYYTIPYHINMHW